MIDVTKLKGFDEGLDVGRGKPWDFYNEAHCIIHGKHCSGKSTLLTYFGKELSECCQLSVVGLGEDLRGSFRYDGYFEGSSLSTLLKTVCDMIEKSIKSKEDCYKNPKVVLIDDLDIHLLNVEDIDKVLDMLEYILNNGVLAGVYIIAATSEDLSKRYRNLPFGLSLEC